jgi:hypothetical protein
MLVAKSVAERGEIVRDEFLQTHDFGSMSPQERRNPGKVLGTLDVDGR